MQQRISIITIGADNLTAMKDFYTHKFGWRIEAQAKDITFFKLNGLLLGLYGRKDLAEFVGSSAAGSGFRPYTLAYMVSSDAEVLEIHHQLKSKGVIIIKEPTLPSFGGSYFLLQDIERNICEIAHNPFISLDQDGNVTTHRNIDNL